METETWKPVPGFETLYSVSDMGNVRREKGQWCRSQRPLKRVIDNRGYCIVNLVNRQKKIYARVHRLVTIAFSGIDPERPEVNHKNLNRADNRRENLEWCTGIENVRHGFKMRGNYVAKGSEHCCAKLTESKITEIRLLSMSGKYTGIELSRRFQVNPSAITKIVKGYSWKHVPMPTPSLS